MAKRGGRRSLSVERRKRFALTLYAVIRDRCRSFEQFKKLLAKKKTTVREVTIRGWLPPLERLDQDPDAGSRVFRRDWESLRAADLPGLLEVAEILDVSIDHLLGYPVPERRSDREPVGELATALIDYVVRDYIRRAPHQRRDGLAETVGGLLNSEPLSVRRKMPAHGDASSGTFQIDVGNAVLLRRLLLVVNNPQSFLAQTADWTFQRAERWEEEHKEPERQLVRDEVRRLARHLDVLSLELERSPDQVLMVLLDGALDPLDPNKQSWVLGLGRDLRAYQERAASDTAAEEEFATSFAEFYSELERKQITSPRRLTPQGIVENPEVRAFPKKKAKRKGSK